MTENQSASQRTKIIAVIGPTASGKSDLGIFLAKKFDGEIISADSRQVYRGMDIGTGKVSKKEQQIAKHHLLDVINSKKIFTVSDFKKLASKAISDITNRGKLPIIVGGTGFYIDALVKEFSIPEVPPNKKLRIQLDKLSLETLFKKLKKFDPQRAKIIDPKNKRRLVRALEIIKTTGKPVPELKESLKYEVLYIGINPSKNILKKRIKLRLEKRLKQGMVKEVKTLLKSGVSKKRLDDLGLEYRWVSKWLKNHKNDKHALFSNSQEYKNLLRNIIKYSKRQMTWFTRQNFATQNLGGFKRNEEIHWINPPAGGRKEAQKIIRKFLASHP